MQAKKRKFIFARGKKLWCRLKYPDGTWKNRTTGFHLGQEVEALRYAKSGQRILDKQAEAGRPAANVTLNEYSVIWLEARKAEGHEWKNDRGRLRHVLAKLGPQKMSDIRKVHIIEAFKEIRAEAKIAPRTIYNVYSVLSALLRDAEDTEVIELAPAKLTKKHLGPKLDKDLSWRGEAVFTREEVEALISSDLIPPDRRACYALDFLAGIRQGEAAALQWRHWDQGKQPLGELRIEASYNSKTKVIKTTKTGQ